MICGIRTVQAAKHCCILRAGYRVAARVRSRRFEIHRSSCFFAGRGPTTFQQPSIKIAVEHPASTLRDFDGGRTFAERNKAFKRASDYSGSCRGLVVRQNLH